MQHNIIVNECVPLYLYVLLRYKKSRKRRSTHTSTTTSTQMAEKNSTDESRRPVIVELSAQVENKIVIINITVAAAY